MHGLQKGSKKHRIIEAIPYDEWIKASDVEAKTGIKAHSVGALINHYLLNVSIERRQIRLHGGKLYEYRRIVNV